MFSQQYFVFNQHNLKLKIFTLPKSVCFVTNWRSMWPWRHRSMYFT